MIEISNENVVENLKQLIEQLEDEKTEKFPVFILMLHGNKDDGCMASTFSNISDCRNLELLDNEVDHLCNNVLVELFGAFIWYQRITNIFWKSVL